MSMFSTYGTSGSDERKPDTLAKLERLRKTFAHEEPDRVAISDFFWGGFRERWRRELGLPADTDPYYHYDLDFIVTVPNMDPHIRPFETIREDDEEVVVKTGFETTIRKRFDLPMPEQVSWETDTIEKMEAFEFDDPADRRRYFEAGDNQIAGRGRRLRAQQPALGRDRQVAPPGLPGLRQHHRDRRDHHPPAGPAQHADLDRRVPGALRGAAAAHRRVQLPGGQGPDRGRRRAPRRPGHLG